jgi:hypothetical protein
MNVKNLIGALMLTAAASVAMAQETVNIIHSLPPGGLHERTNNAVQAGLELAGIKTSLVRFTNCKGLEKWVKDNPTKPVVFDYLLVNQALGQVQPEHPGACNLPLDSKSVIAITFQTQFQACSLAAAGNARDLWLSGRGKLGVTASPDLNGIMAERIIADVNPNTKIVRYKGNAALIQALTSREIDFAGQFSNASGVISAGGQCFFTTADIAKAEKFGQISIDSVKKNSTASGFGYMGVIVGYNVDVEKLRPVVANTIRTNKDLGTVFANGGEQRGIVAGKTAEEQYQEVQSWLSRFRK